MSDSDVYWAAHTDVRMVVSELRDIQRRYLERLGAMGLSRRSVRALACYYGFGANGQANTSELGLSGDAGQYVEMAVNEFARLVDQTTAQLLASKPAYQAVPKSGDFEAMAQARFADQVLDSLDRDAGVEEVEDEAVKLGLLAREGWVIASWDKTKGEVLAQVGGVVAMGGDVRLDVCTAHDIIVDDAVWHRQHQQWVCWSRPISRWDLVALQAPRPDDPPDVAQRRRELQERLKAVGGKNPVEYSRMREWLMGEADSNRTRGDQVVVWEFRHLPTPALPQGRLMQFVDEETVLYDSASEKVGYPYDGLHAVVFEPAKIVGTARGYTPTFDLLGLSETVDSVATAGATAVGAGAISNLWAPPNSNLTVSTVGEGMNLVESTVEPVPLHLVKVDPEAIGFMSACREYMQGRLGLNDVAMGDPSKGMPASLAALLDAKAVQFWSTATKSLSQMRARLRTAILSIYQRRADVERTSLLVGKNNAWMTSTWNRDKLSLVARVTVDPVSAASKSIAGKLAMADLLLERGLINTVDEYLTVRATGRIEKLTEFKDRNLLRLQQEKELLQQGIGLPPIDVRATDEARALNPDALPVFLDDNRKHIRPTLVDTPWLDIAEYAAVLAAPDARDNAAVVRAVQDLIQLKVQMWRQMPPELIAALGGYPPPPPNAPLPPDVGVEDAEMRPAEALAQETRSIRAPLPPENPITGEQPEAATEDVSQPTN